jgi:mono/diheme cytochrome c family protein
MKNFFSGILAGWLLFIVGGFLFIWAGGMPVSTSSPPLPFEKFLAKTALHAAFRGAENLRSPIEATDANILAGAKLYKSDCAFCHGLPDTEKAVPSVTFFPPAPQLYHHGVDDDPIGETYLKVKNGIRMSAMPGFTGVYTEEQLWQVSLLLSKGTHLPESAKQELLKK